MPSRIPVWTTIILIAAIAAFSSGLAPDQAQTVEEGMEIMLPEPLTSGSISLEAALASRRSVREYDSRPLTINEVSQLLWAAQGITSDWGGRTAPSAGALYPLKIYLVAGLVDGLDSGVYLYSPQTHSLSRVLSGDIRRDLQTAALNQSSIGQAPVSIVITGVPSITEARYGDRAMRYIDNEVGCVSQNIYLQCESLGLGTVAMGAFYDEDVARAIGTDASPRLIMPVGAPL
jgi:SagB-type dehydrogenase family enzyme